MDRPTRGVSPGGVIAGVGAACQAVADHLASDGRLQPSVWLERGGRLRCTARAGAGGNRPEAAEREPAAVRTAFASGVETVVADIAPGADAPLGAFRARTCLPIRVGGRVAGVLDVLLREPVRLADLELLCAAVDDLSERLAAERRAPAESAATRMLRHVARLSALQQPEAIARTVLAAALELTALDTAALLRRGADGRLHTLASVGPLAAALHTGAPDALDAIAAAADGTARVVTGTAAPAAPAPDATTDPDHRVLAAVGADALVVVVLVAEGESQGVLLLAGDPASAAAPGDAELLEALAANAASCLQTADLLGTLRERAATDPLTGLGHHATFHEPLAQAHRRPSTAVVLCDIDGFKRLNDTFGHQHGDSVLRGVAAALGDALRRGDSLFRIGGDEFAALLAVSSPEEAVGAGERLRAAVERAALGVTLSIGVAVPQRDEPDVAVLARADRALYRVKAAGREGGAICADE
jgi:diguanylate cyclase (GGDEF)-like protein